MLAQRTPVRDRAAAVRPHPTRRKLTVEGILLSIGYCDTPDVVSLTETCWAIRTAIHENAAVAEVAWRRLSFRGPFPFGYRSCCTYYGHAGRMMVPELLETVLRRHSSRVRAFAAGDCLFNDSCLSLVLRYCTALSAIDLSNSEHRVELNRPRLPSCVSGASLVTLRHTTALTDLQLRHSQVRVRGCDAQERVDIVLCSLLRSRTVVWRCCQRVCAVSAASTWLAAGN